MTLQKKYIPETWDQIIGQSEVVPTLRQYSSIEELPHLLFAGTSGVGKTACAYVLAKELGVVLIELNASDERGIDVVRDKIKTLLFTSGERIILLDEADSLTIDAQAALRRPMEQALQRTNNRLILTVNRPWKIIDAISSRCTNFYFKPLSEGALRQITINVLKSENIKFKDIKETNLVVNALVTHSKGDARKLLDVIDSYSHSKESLIQYVRKRNAEVNLVMEILQTSVSGDWQESLMKLESFLIQQPTTNNSEVIEMFYAEVKDLDIPSLHKFQIYQRLADTERALKISCNPLIQLSGFLVSVMAIARYKGGE